MRCILFDLDGTLINSLPDLRQSLNFIRHFFQLSPLSGSQVQSFIGDGAWKLVERTLCNLDPEAIQKGFQLFRSHYLQHCADYSSLYPKCAETLKKIRERNLKIGIVTNKPDEMSLRILAAFGLIPLVDTLIGGDQAEEKKPSPKPIAQALRNLHCSPEEAIMVGDSANDMDAAKSAGVKSCGVTYGFSHPRTSDGSAPDFLIDSISELSSLLATNFQVPFPGQRAKPDSGSHP